jgi:hypothetical protein
MCASCHNGEAATNKKVSRAARGYPKQRCNATRRDTWRVHLAGVRPSSPVRAGGTVRRSIMNECNSKLNAMPNGFSAVSREELDQIEGGNIITTVTNALGTVMSKVGEVLEIAAFETLYWSVR